MYSFKIECWLVYVCTYMVIQVSFKLGFLFNTFYF